METREEASLVSNPAQTRMNLPVFIAKRAFHSIFVLLGLSIVIFVISSVVPGDPVRLAVGSRAPQWVVDNMREQMHLNVDLKSVTEMF